MGRQHDRYVQTRVELLNHLRDGGGALQDLRRAYWNGDFSDARRGRRAPIRGTPLARAETGAGLRGAADPRCDRCVYSLAMHLFTARYRPSGKTFIAHVVGVASILAAHVGSIDLIRAGLPHSAHSEGDFGGVGTAAAGRPIGSAAELRCGARCARSRAGGRSRCPLDDGRRPTVPRKGEVGMPGWR